MQKNSYRKITAFAAMSGLVMVTLYVLFLIWVPAAHFTNESGKKLTNVSVSYSTGSEEQVVNVNKVLPGESVLIREFSNDLKVGLLRCDSVNGEIVFPVAEDLQPTEKLRIAVQSKIEHSRSITHFW